MKIVAVVPESWLGVVPALPYLRGQAQAQAGTGRCLALEGG